MSGPGWARTKRVGRVLAGALLGVLALVVLVHACIVLLEALVLTLIAVMAAALVLPRHWRFLRRRVSSLAAAWAVSAAAWAETALRAGAASCPTPGDKENAERKEEAAKSGH